MVDFWREVRPGRVLLPLFGLVALSALLLVGLWPTTSYTVYADGEQILVNGSYENVGQVLDAAGISIRSEDLVNPPLTAAAPPGTAIQIERAKAVTLRTETGSRTIWTLQPTLGAMLAEARVFPLPTDQIVVDGRPLTFTDLDAAPLPGLVEIGRFVTITIADGEQRFTRRTAVPTVGQALQEAGLTLYAADGVTPPLGSWLEPGLTITIRRSMPIAIVADGRRLETRSHHSNPLDVLAEIGIGLVGQDFTRPGPEARLQPGDTIYVIRVTEDFRLVDTTIPFQTLWQPTDQLEIDQRALLSAGSPGIMRQRVRVRYENGIEVSQTLDGEWVAREPVNEVLGYGTNIVVRSLDTPEGPLEYWRRCGCASPPIPRRLPVDRGMIPPMALPPAACPPVLAWWPSIAAWCPSAATSTCRATAGALPAIPAVACAAAGLTWAMTKALSAPGAATLTSIT
jgi:resuscitation-promoting factor RpfB